MATQPRDLQLFRYGGAVAGLAGAAAGQIRREGLLLRIADADGGLGQGEASPLPGYSPDTIEQCAQQLAAVDLAALPPPGNLPALTWAGRALDCVELSAPAARFALETALLDWLGRRRGASLASLLGAAAPDRRLPLSALVADVATARAAYARGLRTFKLKTSQRSLGDDLRLAQALRAEFGPAITLRFDANGGFDPAGAAAELRALAGCAPEFVEEPVALPEFLRINPTLVPLAADESLARAGAWPALAAVCRVLVLKPTLLGGLGACLRLAGDAAGRGLAVTVSHSFDGPVALAAAAELAVTLPGKVLACGLVPHAALAAWPPLAIAQVQGAEVGSAARPGLGLPAIGLAAAVQVHRSSPGK